MDTLKQVVGLVFLSIMVFPLIAGLDVSGVIWLLPKRVAAKTGSPPIDEAAIQTMGNIDLVPISEGDTYAVGVKLHDGIKADGAIVVIQYKTTMRVNGVDLPHELILHKTSVIPVFAGTFSMSDAAPTTKEKVTNVQVTLYTEGEKQKFLLSK